MPKLLRPYFLHHRELLGRLSQAAWQTVAEMKIIAVITEPAVVDGILATLTRIICLLAGAHQRSPQHPRRVERQPRSR